MDLSNVIDLIKELKKVANFVHGDGYGNEKNVISCNCSLDKDGNIASTREDRVICLDFKVAAE